MVFLEGQMIGTGFNAKISSVMVRWKTLNVVCNYFSPCCRKILPSLNISSAQWCKHSVEERGELAFRMGVSRSSRKGDILPLSWA